MISGYLFEVEWDSILCYNPKACGEVNSMTEEERTKILERPMYIISKTFMEAVELSKKYENKYLKVKAITLDKKFPYSRIGVVNDSK